MRPFPTPFSALTTVAGLQVVWRAADDWQATLCQLRRTGKTVTIAQQRTGLPDVAALTAVLGPEPCPVALVLAGRGLLFRTLPQASPDQLTVSAGQFAALLPGSNAADFYCQCRIEDEQLQVVLVRKQPVDELLAALQAAGLWVIELSLGPLRFGGLLPYLTALPGDADLPAGPFQLTLNSARNAVSTFTASPPGEVAPAAVTYQVGEEALPSALALPYAAALQVLTDGLSGTGTEELTVPAVQQLRGEWYHRRLFHGLRLALPLGILGVLLANLLIGQQLQAQQDRLTTTLGGSQQLLTRVAAMQRAGERQQAFLTATGWTLPSVNSVCADRLAASLPPGIQLLTADISPLQQGNGEPGHRLSFRPDVVLVRGQCRNAQQFNTWLQQLTKLPWVSAVRDQNFAYDYAGSTGTFTFTLLLNPAALRT